MSQNTGTLISAAIRPNNSSDLIASAFSFEINGGHHSYATLTNRNSLISQRREWGMLCSVYNDSVNNGTYQLVYGHSSTVITNNLNWVKFAGTGNDTASYWIDPAISVRLIEPTEPSSGDRYLVGLNNSSNLSGSNWQNYPSGGYVVEWDSNLSNWSKITPDYGMSIRVNNEPNSVYRYNGTFSTGGWVKEKVNQVKLVSATSSNSTTFTSTLPGLYSYDTDNLYLIQFATGNGASPTLNINNLGAKPIKYQTNGGLINLVQNDINVNVIYSILYDGTNFRLNKPPSDTSLVKYRILPGERVSVPANHEYLIYGDFLVEGNLDIDINGKVILINGSLSLNGGTISNSSNIELITLPTSTYSADLGNILYVSKNGDDSNGLKGYINKPFLTLKAARDASSLGDTIHVFPQTITFDNSDSVGNPYNGVWQNDVNLWKNGVTYYFEAGTYINCINQNGSENMSLFNSKTTTGESCKVLGYLEFTSTSLGSDSVDGQFLYLNNLDIIGGGFKFFSETKKLTSNSSQLIHLTDNSVGLIDVTIISDEEEKNYISGSVGSGSIYIIEGVGLGQIKFKSDVNRRYNNNCPYAFFIKGNLSTSSININGNYMYSYNCVCYFENLECYDININITDIYYVNAFSSSGSLGSILSTNDSNINWILNLESNLYDNSSNSLTDGLFQIKSTGFGVINYKGNITTNTSSGIGRFIVSNEVNNNVVNINGNINLMGTGTTSNVIMQSFGTSEINFSGEIKGKYNYTFHPRTGSTINVNNSNIKSTADNFILYDHTDTTTSTLRLNNSYFEGSNKIGSYGDGQYLNVLISNSSIVNSCTGSTYGTMLNDTNSGKLQILNSSIYTLGDLSIDYVGTSSQVISSNTIVSATYSIFNLSGDITLLPSLIR